MIESMYKTKVWIHKNIEEILSNDGKFWITYTFVDKPKKSDIIHITDSMAEDISDEHLWISQYGPGNYKIHSAKDIFEPKTNDGFKYSAMAYKIIYKQ